MAYLVRQRHRAPALTARIEPDATLPRVCVIGAGSSGIAAAKALHEARVPFECYEAGPVVGGNWVLENPNGRSACYDSLEINTSCPRMAYSDFPMPEDYPPYARHDQVAAYFTNYVEHFGFGHTITFDTLRSGSLVPRPAVARLGGDRVTFIDGSSAPVDLIVWATGYRVSFPFLSAEVVDVRRNSLPLWHRAVHPDRPGLLFVGLVQAVGAAMPIAEAQGAWIAEMMTGRYVPPTDDVVRAQAERQDTAYRRRFYASERHTMEVDFDRYLWTLSRERRRGAARARARGPVSSPAAT